MRPAVTLLPLPAVALVVVVLVSVINIEILRTLVGSPENEPTCQARVWSRAKIRRECLQNGHHRGGAAATDRRTGGGLETGRLALFRPVFLRNCVPPLSRNTAGVWPVRRRKSVVK